MQFPDPVEMSDGSGDSGLDSFGQAIETWWKKGPDVMQKASYGYDRASNRKWRRDDLAHDLGADPRGNWQKYGSAAESNLQQTRCHNAANEITQVTHPGGVIQPAYDEVGNQTLDIAPGDRDRGFSLKWDAWNRLIEVKDGNTLIQTNAYDGLSRRITSGAGTDITHYYYNDAWRAVEEYTDADPDDPACRYLWGLRSRWDLVKRERSDSGTLDEKRYVLYDAMDPVAICDEDGEVVQRFEYSPFGRTTFLSPDFAPVTPTEDWSFLFHGEFRDEATGYYNYGFRYYNDTTGRWPSRDPIEERGGLNLYGFVGNQGVSRFDYLGLETITVEHCEVKIVAGHGARPRNTKWKLKGCSLRKVAGCRPRTNAPPGRAFEAHDSPTGHDNLMAIGEGTDRGLADAQRHSWNLSNNPDFIPGEDPEPAMEHGIPEAIDNMTDPESIRENVEKLCRCDCTRQCGQNGSA
jgi:RHS repeat-associated protein